MMKKNNSLCKFTHVSSLGYLYLGKRRMILSFLLLFFSFVLFAQNTSGGEKPIHVFGDAVIFSSDENFNSHIDENKVVKLPIDATDGSKSYVFTTKQSSIVKPTTSLATNKQIQKKQPSTIKDFAKKMVVAKHKPKETLAPVPKQSTSYVYKSLGSNLAANIPTYYSKTFLSTETTSAYKRDFISYLKINSYYISEILFIYSETYRVRPPPSQFA